jgi:hypothetical protein
VKRKKEKEERTHADLFCVGLKSDDLWVLIVCFFEHQVYLGGEVGGEEGYPFLPYALLCCLPRIRSVE